MADAGASDVDTYRALFMGFNALGKAEAQPMMQKMTGPFDKLGRFVSIGWYWVGDYSIIDQDAIWMAIGASSVGVNA